MYSAKWKRRGENFGKWWKVLEELFKKKNFESLQVIRQGIRTHQCKTNSLFCSAWQVWILIVTLLTYGSISNYKFPKIQADYEKFKKNCHFALDTFDALTKHSLKNTQEFSIWIPTTITLSVRFQGLLCWVEKLDDNIPLVGLLSLYYLQANNTKQIPKRTFWLNPFLCDVIRKSSEYE